jgi:16S rRNA (guanine527-N7)-methyltransferase
VKHSPRAPLLDPAQIGKSVRTTVEAFLHNVQSTLESEFPERIEKLAVNLARWGSKMNLTAHPEEPDEIAFHVIDSLMPVILGSDKSIILSDEFVQRRRILDLGSGAGFPGLVLAAAAPAQFTLVESRRKRASFLQVVVAEMGLKNVIVEGRRAEDIGLASQYDLVTARAFGDAEVFFALAAKALRMGGLAMLYANPSQRASLQKCQIIEYSVGHHTQKIQRILALCRQLVEDPRGQN